MDDVRNIERGQWAGTKTSGSWRTIGPPRSHVSNEEGGRKRPPLSQTHQAYISILTRYYISMNNIEWIFLDLGWTLVDEIQAHRARLEVVRERLEGFGHCYSVDELMTLCEQAATDFAPSPFRGMLARLDLSEDQIRTLADSVRYEHENEVLYPGVSGASQASLSWPIQARRHCQPIRGYRGSGLRDGASGTLSLLFSRPLNLASPSPIPGYSGRPFPWPGAPPRTH